MGTGIISHSSTSLERFVLSNLTPDSEYTVVVAAQTNVGSGPSSDVISVHIGIGSKFRNSGNTCASGNELMDEFFTNLINTMLCGK